MICGPMFFIISILVFNILLFFRFSGKSTELQRMVRRYKLAAKKCLVVNFIADSRYNNDECVTTHDK